MDLLWRTESSIIPIQPHKVVTVWGDRSVFSRVAKEISIYHRWQVAGLNRGLLKGLDGTLNRTWGDLVREIITGYPHVQYISGYLGLIYSYYFLGIGND